MLSTWLNFGGVLSETFLAIFFFVKFQIRFSPVEHSICHILPIDVKQKGNESTGCYADWGTFDLEFSRSNCISGMGGPIVMERKGRESIGCPDVKRYGNESTGRCANWGTFDLDPWPWIFMVKLYLGNGRPDCHGTKGTGVDRMPWCETLRKWVSWTLCWLGYLWPRLSMVKLYLGNGRPDCHGTKGMGVDRMPWYET